MVYRKDSILKVTQPRDTKMAKVGQTSTHLAGISKVPITLW